MSSESFRYRPLQRHQIRVITLAPDSSALGCTGELHHINLKQKPISTREYVTLSYTWGDATDTYAFICEGQSLPIRSNLRDALRRLVDWKRPLWIDAICINQADEEEKLWQIQMMTEIYQRASLVVIWLGEENEAVRKMFDRIPTTTKLLKRFKQHDEAKVIIDGDLGKGIDDLLTRPWWPRLWVLQEATLARNATFVCGSYQIPWVGLFSLTKELRRLDLVQVCRGDTKQADYCDGYNELNNIEAARRTHSINLAPNLLQDARSRICFDPCDRVYGVMGLLPSMFRKSFTWEPGETVQELYPPFAAMMLQADAVGVVLSLVETTERTPGLPSWCPDLHYRGDADILATYEGYHAGYNVHSTSEFEYDMDNPQRLITKGDVADTIAEVVKGQWQDISDPLDTSELDIEKVRSNRDWLESCTKAAVPYVQDELWRVFIGDIVVEERSRLDWLSGFGSIHDKLRKRRWRQQYEDSKEAFTTLQDFLNSLESFLIGSVDEADEQKVVPVPSSILAVYLKTMRRVCVGRKCFITTHGRIGIGPSRSNPGDLVCVLKAMNVPFIFRNAQEEGAFTVVGEAYVQGLMQGEFLKNGGKFRPVVLL